MPTRSPQGESRVGHGRHVELEALLPAEAVAPRDPRRPARVPGRRSVLGAAAGGFVAALVLVAAVVLVWRPLGDEDPPAPSPSEAVLAEPSPAPPPDPRLAWAPPTLTDPETIEITNGNNQPWLEPGKDYRLVINEPITAEGGVIIKGGRNVVLIGGEIEVPDREDAGRSVLRRGLYLTEQTGTVHVEGLHIRGDDLSEGINIDQRDGAVVQLQNIRVEKVNGSKDGHHADVIQTWAGPSVLRIDKFTGHTEYQGFFLLPRQLAEGPRPEFDIRRVDLHGDEDSEYLLWQSKNETISLDVEDVYVESEAWDDMDRYVRPLSDWDGVEEGTPPDGDFVPADSVGVDYVSPGYRS